MRLIAQLITLALALASLPLPAQQVVIGGSDTVTLERGARYVVRADAFSTRGWLVSRATIRLSVASALEVRGDTLVAGTPDSLYLVRATWLRADGARPSDSVWIRIVEPPSAPDTTAPPPLVARFVADCDGLTCAFDATISDVPGFPIRRWDFGDGSINDEPSNGRPTHTYQAAGAYAVRLTLRFGGDSSVMVDSVYATGTAPIPPPTDTTPAPPPPPPPPPSGNPGLPPGSHEPAGYRLLNDRPFRSKVVKAGQYPTPAERLLGEGWSTTEASHPQFTIVADPTAPSGDGSVGQMFYPSTHRAGTGPGTATYYLPDGIREVYISIWMKLSSNWVGNQAAVNKMFFFGVASGNNQFIFDAHGAGANSLAALTSVQGIFDATTHGHYHHANLGVSPRVVRGQWQRFEFVFKCNSGLARADGSMEAWADGVKYFAEFNTNWTQSNHPTRACDMNVFNWNPTYGGGGPAVPHDQWLRFDRVYVSGR